MNREGALNAAKMAVSDRPNQYGSPEDNFDRIAALWNAYLQGYTGYTPLTAPDIAAMMALLKIARILHDPQHADSWIDLAGYAACGAEVSRCRPLYSYSVVENNE